MLTLYIYHMASRVTYQNISPEVTRKPWRVMSPDAPSYDHEGRQLIAIGHLSDSGDLKNHIDKWIWFYTLLYKCYTYLFLKLSWMCSVCAHFGNNQASIRTRWPQLYPPLLACQKVLWSESCLQFWKVFYNLECW